MQDLAICSAILLVVGAGCDLSETDDFAFEAAADQEWSETVEAWGTFNAAVGQARYDHARGALIEAQAAGQWVRVRQLQVFIRQMETQYRQLVRELGVRRRESRHIREHADRIGVFVRTGQYNRKIDQAIGFFQTGMLAETYTDMVSIPLISEERAPDNFRWSAGRGIEAAIPPCTAEDVGQLFVWLRQTGYKIALEKDAGAYRKVFRAVSILRAHQRAGELRTILRDQMNALRSGHYDIWSAPVSDANFWAPTVSPSPARTAPSGS